MEIIYMAADMIGYIWLTFWGYIFIIIIVLAPIFALLDHFYPKVGKRGRN